MEPVMIPAADVNDEEAVVVEWHVEDGEEVRRDQLLVEVETSKAVIEVVAPADGFLLRAASEGDEVRLDAPVAHLLPDRASLEVARARREEHHEALVAARSNGSVRATRGAQDLAAAHGVDLAVIEKDGLITSKDVEALVAGPAVATSPAVEHLPQPLPGTGAGRRVVLIGAGLGATQVLDILLHDEGTEAVAIVDDDESLWGDDIDGVPVVGGSDRLGELHAGRCVDAAVITISTSVDARRALRARCRDLGIPLANAVDPTARIARGVTLGEGNVLCAFVHLGVGAVVGDNCFLSAYNSFDHHCHLGSDISTGPGCMASGLVEVADGVRMGTGVFVEPRVRIGANAIVASGSVLVSSVPDDHVVKARSGATSVSPRRR